LLTTTKGSCQLPYASCRPRPARRTSASQFIHTTPLCFRFASSPSTAFCEHFERLFIRIQSREVTI
jgi:hypothetical protein